MKELLATATWSEDGKIATVTTEKIKELNYDLGRPLTIMKKRMVARGFQFVSEIPPEWKFYHPFLEETGDKNWIEGLFNF